MYRLPKVLKTTISCRLDPELKKVLQVEAFEKETTASNYIESILENRDFILSNEDRELLIQSKKELEIELEKLKKENDYLNQKLLLTEEEDKEKTKEIEYLEKLTKEQSESFLVQLGNIKKMSLQFKRDQIEDFNKEVQKVKSLYPDVSPQDLVVASLKASLANESDRWFIHTIKKYL